MKWDEKLPEDPFVPLPYRSVDATYYSAKYDLNLTDLEDSSAFSNEGRLASVEQHARQESAGACTPLLATSSPLSRNFTTTPQETVLSALQEEDPYRLLYAFVQACKDPMYIGSIPPTTFIEILRFLDPEYFVEPYKDVYRDLLESSIRCLDDGTPQVQDIFAQYVATMLDICERRRACGRKLEIQEYRMMLNAARSVGDGNTVVAIWDDMATNNIQPDTICYNHYTEARCWNKAYHPDEREKLRVIPYYLVRREQQNNSRWGYKVGLRGLKSLVTETFSRMVGHGLMADAKTYSLLMTAMSKEGDLEGVKSILKGVWDVDVEDILGHEDRPIKAAELSRDSPLYPTSDFLFILAHIFGSNNELPAALRIVDHVSRKYSIPIDLRAWSQMFEWSFVLASRRSKNDPEASGSRLGQLPKDSVEQIWNIMVAEPYNVCPTVPMINRYVHNLWRRAKLVEMLRQMRVGISQHREQKELYHQQRKHLLNFEQAAVSQSSIATLTGREHAIRHDVELFRLQEYRNFIMVSNWLRLLLCVRVKNIEWERRQLPKAIREFWHYRMRQGIKYHTSTGTIHLNSESSQMEVYKGPSAQEHVYIARDIPCDITTGAIHFNSGIFK